MTVYRTPQIQANSNLAIVIHGHPMVTVDSPSQQRPYFLILKTDLSQIMITSDYAVQRCT